MRIYLSKTIQTGLLQSSSSNCVSETFCMLISCSTKFIRSQCIKSNVILQQYYQQARKKDAFRWFYFAFVFGKRDEERDTKLQKGKSNVKFLFEKSATSVDFMQLVHLQCQWLSFTLSRCSCYSKIWKSNSALFTTQRHVIVQVLIES